MRFGTWNVRSLNKSGSLTTVARELTIYKLDLVGVQGVRWDTGAHIDLDIIIFPMEKKVKSSIRNRFLYPAE